MHNPIRAPDGSKITTCVPASVPVLKSPRTYDQVFGSPRKPFKLLKVIDRKELGSWRSTAELLPPWWLTPEFL